MTKESLSKPFNIDKEILQRTPAAREEQELTVGVMWDWTAPAQQKKPSAESKQFTQ